MMKDFDQWSLITNTAFLWSQVTEQWKLKRVQAKKNSTTKGEYFSQGNQSSCKLRENSVCSSSREKQKQTGQTVQWIYSSAKTK